MFYRFTLLLRIYRQIVTYNETFTLEQRANYYYYLLKETAKHKIKH